MQLSDEIRSIIDEGKRAPSSQITEEYKEPIDEVFNLLSTHTDLTTLLQRKLDALSGAFGVAKQQAAKVGGENDKRAEVFEIFKAAPLSALRELKSIIDKSIQHVENVCRRSEYKREIPSYGGSWVGESIESTDLSEYESDMAMDKIQPGVILKLGEQVFRVLSKSGNSALIQPDYIQEQRFGPAAGYPSPQSPVPSGMTIAQDVTPQPVGGDLVGASIFKYVPETGLFQYCTGIMPGSYEMATVIQIVGHDPSMPNIAEDMTVEEFELMLSEAEPTDIIEKLRTVAEGEEARLVNSVLVDSDTARVAVEMYDGFQDDGNRIKMGSMNIHEVLRTTFSVLSKMDEAGGWTDPLDKRGEAYPKQWIGMENRKSSLTTYIALIILNVLNDWNFASTKNLIHSVRGYLEYGIGKEAVKKVSDADIMKVIHAMEKKKMITTKGEHDSGKVELAGDEPNTIPNRKKKVKAFVSKLKGLSL